MLLKLEKGEVRVGMTVEYTEPCGLLIKRMVEKLGKEGDYGFYLAGGEVYADSMWDDTPVFQVIEEEFPTLVSEDLTEEYTGKSVSYYKVDIINPTTAEEPYTVECNDVIEALGMNYAEGNQFKSIWRRCAARKLGKSKKGYGSGLYDAEKGVFFAERVLIQAEEEEKRNDE